MEYKEFTGKTVDEAMTNASIALGAASDSLEIEVLEKGTSGFLGIGAKPAKIKARKVVTLEGIATEFLQEVFKAMNLEVTIKIEYDEAESNMNIDLVGDDMGVLIGKRGQTLDSLQYLVSLVVNKESEKYCRIKLDTEDYRNRRKETLENLAKNIASKVKRTRRKVSLEPMNPYERRVIHSTLQNDKFVATKSEGEEPFRHVVVYLKNTGKTYSRYSKPSYHAGIDKTESETVE
ncbi:MAG: protein jag [Lachnospiraceae bacterium]|nr:protein jag [Lachnospiraceae bacterium]